MTRTIIALDFPTREQTLAFLDQFKEPVYVKIGMELFDGCGPDIVKEIKARGHHIFLDLKLHDIPNTVRGAMRNLAGLGADIINVHCAGGIEMMKAALKGAEEGTPEGKEPPKIIGVTILTSISEDILHEELNIEGEVRETVRKYALNAKKAGLAGVVSSPYEAALIHEVCGSDFLTVTPGIRLQGDDKNDQKRAADPLFARENGCDMIVVGRSITKAADPVKTYEEIERIMNDGRI